MRTKPKTTPVPVRRCPDCGIETPASAFQADRPAESIWVRCAECTAAGRDGAAAAMLARIGVEHPADDPAVIAALHRVAWRAVAVESQRVNAEVDKRSRPALRDEPDSVREARLARARADLDQVGPASAEPWAHVDPRAVRRVIEESLVSAMQARKPRRCTGGPCGVCGARTAASWPDTVRIGTVSTLDPSPIRSEWPICDTCEPLLSAAGGVATSEAARRRWTAAVLGVEASPPSLSVPALVGTYAEFVGVKTNPTTAEGCPVPWEFVSTADRDILAQAAPQYRAPEVLDRERRATAALARLDRARRATGPRSALAAGSDR